VTALGSLLAAGRLTSAAIQGIAPLASIKALDESVTSSTTLQNDDALWLPVAANAGYFVLCWLDYQGGTQGSSDLKLQWTGPAGSSLSLSAVYYPTSGGVGANTNLSAITGLSTLIEAGTDGARALAMLMFGTLLTGSTPGTFQLQWAQNTSSATATTVHAMSALGAWQVQ